VTTAWFFFSVKQTAEMAEILGISGDFKKYSDLAQKIKSAYKKEFFPVKSKRSCKYVRPLYMGIANGEEKIKISADLNKKCISNNYKISTGFLTTYKLLEVLSDNGYAQTAYKILENEEMPGWLYEVNKGATTVWENWCGIDENGVPKNSLNHYGEAAVCAWLFSRCAGIRPLKCGFDEILINPVIGGTFKSVNAEFVSVKGKISVRWNLENGNFKLNADVPSGVKTTVIMPDKSKKIISEGGKIEMVCQV
jgi:alpha-L-rhamnosidase